MTNKHLTKEEKALDKLLTVDYIKHNRLTPAQLEKEKTRLASFSVQKPKKKMISLRVLEHDIVKIKSKAEMMGIPYQTYIVSHIHQLAQE